MTTKELKPTRPQRTLQPLTLTETLRKTFDVPEMRPYDYVVFLTNLVSFAMETESFELHLEQENRRVLFAQRLRYLTEFLEDLEDLGLPKSLEKL